METIALNILPGIGLEKLVTFGQLANDVVRVLGEPDKVNEVGSESEEGPVHYYNKLKLKLKYSIEESNKLYSIDVYHPDTYLFGQKVIGLPKDSVLRIFQKSHHSNFEETSYDTFDTIFVEELWMTLMFEFNYLRSIEFSPLYVNERLDWPKQSKGSLF